MSRRYKWYIPYTISRSTYAKVKRITRASGVYKIANGVCNVKYKIDVFLPVLPSLNLVWEVHGKAIFSSAYTPPEQSYSNKKLVKRRTPCKGEEDLIKILKQEKNKKEWEF